MANSLSPFHQQQYHH